jgi:hypothetical protein
LERSGYGQPYPAFFRTRGIIPGRSLAGRGELTSALLDPSYQENPEHFWDGLYPGVEPIWWSAHDTGMDPDEELAQKVADYVPPGGWPEE